MALLQFEDEPRMYLRGEDFEQGFKCEIVKVDKEASEFGVEKFSLGLEPGMAYVFTFLDENENERKYTTTSKGFLYAIRSYDVGDRIIIKKTGQRKDTRWTIVKL